ncbi:opacity protein [Chryseobacterium piperi]|uniref:Opacity protein n=1 Tax=Chryseobacterium piperi TaxID=558152 RepID=A0A086BLA2_9FLAO|nr:outer membrane beta-barrel protein [Chryseobacterium piperi]ASW73370.1 opacity protein [Chryseobacterium piperi]KFF29716.1 opacity protein [Chryseobacterium piperi]
MKKLLLAGVVAFFGLSSAQINKGTVYVSGQAGYFKNNYKNTGDSKEEFKVIPSVGVFIAPNLAVGAGIGYTNGKEISREFFYYNSAFSVEDVTAKPSAFVVAPFVRKYWTLTDKLYIFGQLEVPMKFGKTRYDLESSYVDYQNGYSFQESFSVEEKYTSIGVNIKPGLDYFLNKNWTIEATIGEFGYENLKYKNGGKSINKYDFGLNFSSVTFGVKYIFAK